MNYFRMGTYC